MNISEALAAINKDVQAIRKERKNDQQGYKFRGIDDVMNELHDLFAKNGVVILSKILSSTREDRVVGSNNKVWVYSICTYEFTFLSEDGTTVSCTVSGEGADNGDKSMNKAFSAALKYCLLGMFLIPTDEVKDSETASPEFNAKPKPAAQVPKKVAPTPALVQNELAALSTMPKMRFDAMIGACKKTPENAKELIKQARGFYTFSEDQEKIIAEWIDN